MMTYKLYSPLLFQYSGTT